MFVIEMSMKLGLLGDAAVGSSQPWEAAETVPLSDGDRLTRRQLGTRAAWHRKYKSTRCRLGRSRPANQAMARLLSTPSTCLRDLTRH